MSQSKYILIGAIPDAQYKHPGGQASATQGLMDYCDINQINLDIIDSAQSSFPFPPLYKRIVRSVFRNINLIKKLSLNRYTGAIIFCGSGFSFLEKILSVCICRIFNIKVLLSIRSGFFFDDIESSDLKRYIFSLLLKIPNFHSVQGTKLENLLIDMGVDSKKITLIPNWLPSDFRPSDKLKKVTEGEKIKFLYVGWLVEEKGVHHIYQASQISKHIKDSEIYLAGDGPLLKDLASKTNKDKTNIFFLGWQRKEKIIELMQECHVLVLPSYAEGFPNVVVEALSQNMPLITTDVGGLLDSSIHNHNSFIIDVSDYKNLASSMDRFILQPSLIEEFSINSKKIFNMRHRMEENCSKYFEVFENS
jgi:glycosyltransferase involved in cell wall biosynthesis